MATPAPAVLRALAVDLRATAAAIDLDVEPLADRGGPSTWLGPAADTYRRAAAAMEDVGRSAADGARRLADELDRMAEVEERARADAAADAMLASAARRAAVEEAQEVGHG
jgi:hypothetical protein